MTHAIVTQLCLSNGFPCRCATLSACSNQYGPRPHPCRWDTRLLSTLYCKQTEINVLANRCLCVHVCTADDDEEVELHGKLEDDRFLFSLENNSAACDVLDLREVLSLFVKEG